VRLLEDRSLLKEKHVNEKHEMLLTEQAIRTRVRELGAEISKDCSGKQVVLISVLRGALVFTADLMRCLDFPIGLDFVHASSYGMGMRSSREVRIKKDIETDIAGKHVLLVDCIVDTGETLDSLIKRYQPMNPASVRTAVLLDKRSRRSAAVPIDYVGFVIPDTFVVGYGIDCGEQYRNLPYLAAVTASGAER
jgi:hypoxanthine phosphoribosyltransferase